jgi:hypothetical protein
MEGMADVLHHSSNLKEWFSLYPEDKVFGAKHDFFKQELTGRNTYVNPPFNTFENKQNLIEKVIEKVSDSLRSNLPTRVVLLIPIFDGKVGHLYETQARKSRFLEIATFPKSSFSFVAPEHYHIHNNFQPGFFAGEVGLYLCANKASLQVDPIHWDDLIRGLMAWSHENTKHPPLINNLTCQKFAQRVVPTHASRSFNARINSTFMPSSNFFHYYDFTFPPEEETNSMKTYVQDVKHLELLTRTNQHDRLAGALGILPNHLIQLLRLTNRKELSQIVNDLRFTTFWATYSIWTKRQSLNRTYWRIIPECCKFVKNKTTTLEKKRKRRTKKVELDACRNPFHYLSLKKNMQPSQGTCGCTPWVGQIKRRSNNIEMKLSLNKRTCITPSINQNRGTCKRNFSDLDFKHISSNRSTQLDIRHFVKTSADITREEQDRKKRAKK